MVDYKQPFKERIKRSSNLAEQKCEEYLDSKNVCWHKYGFDNHNIPKDKFVKVPKTIRSIPDYVCVTSKAFFLESKGFKGVLKIKENDLKSYNFWNDIMDLYFYFYDCGKQKQHILSSIKLLEKIDVSKTGYYDDNKQLFYEINL
tara:strand:+ start:1422 stop:1856 length:435 start_codon:yes stop_codon:yes gene_type:complete